MKQLNTFLYAVLAGISIGIGGTVFLACDNKVVGAFFFAVGLFTVCTNGLNLYTGKVLYLFENKPSYLIDLLIIWVGNLVGAWLIGTAVRLTRVAPAYIEKAQGMAEAKVGDSVEFGGLLGSAPIMPVPTQSPAKFIHRGGRIPAPIHSLKN